MVWTTTLDHRRGNSPCLSHWINGLCVGGDGGIRTLDAGLSPHAPLAGEYLQPLGHVSEPPRIVAECAAESHLTRWPCRVRRPGAGRARRAPCICPRPPPIS